MMRIALFLITNLAVVLLASVTLRLLGFDGYMEANGINYTALLIFCFIIGMAGSVISLFLSKMMAKSSTGTVIIEQIFRLPGLGQLLLEAVSTRDYPIITGVFLVTGVVVMLVNLIVDLCYGYLDPKVRFDR